MPLGRITGAIFTIVLLLGTGCGGGYNDMAGEESTNYEVYDIIADAYLYDAKLIRQGKPTSVRLYLFQTDSLIAIGGRGYLGKGALKGQLTKDSLLIYFPTTHEYVRESVTDLFTSFSCASEIPEINIFQFFNQLPDSMLTEKTFTTVKDSADDEIIYRVTVKGCPWKLEVEYDISDDRPLISRFLFFDGTETELKGKLREFKSERDIKSSRFQVVIPDGSFKIIP